VAVSVGKIFKRALLAVFIIFTVLVIFYHELVFYGLRQAKGQLSIIYNARPVEEFLSDPAFPDSLKQRLRLIEEVRRFAIDSLGLKDTENYKTMFDQQGREIMWVVIAAEPFRMEPKTWKFPILGEVPYKGFFNKKLAIELKDQLEAEGYDVIIRNPGGWSTLGWFTDPILSKMLNRSEGDLANLIIHEMSHATIFVKDSVDFNENLATFIGDRGAEMFLVHKYGAGAKQYTTYMAEDRDYLKVVAHMLRGGEILDSLYQTMTETQPVAEKKELKEQTILRIVERFDTLNLEVLQNPLKKLEGRLPNNASFMNYRQYQASQDVFWREWEGRFDRNLKAYIAYLTDVYPFL
jgi:predicted aminopeptidase